MKNKVFSIMLSVVVAFGLWLYVVMVVSPGSENTYYNIPVVLQNENVLKDRGLMITSDLPAVTLTLSGNRTDLNKLDENNINILVNAGGIEAAGIHQLSYDVSLPGSVPDSAITRVGQSTNVITVTVEKRITKRVDIVVEYVGAVPEGFIADKENAVMDYETIEVTGPESVVDKITQARIQVDLTNKNVSVIGRYVYDLCDANNRPVDAKLITTNVEAVNLTVNIQRVKEIQLTLNTIYGGGATDKNCTVTIEPQTIRVSGSDALLGNLNVLELGTLNLAEIPTDQTLTFAITLPEGVTNESGVAEAQVKISFNGLSSKEFEVTQINGINVPEGMEYVLVNEVLKVKLRGLTGLINTIKPEDITATIDFTDKEAGTFTYKPVITINGESYVSVGAVGSYSISATLREAEE